VVDLLYEGAKEAKQVIESFTPTIERDEYVEFMRKLVE